MSDKVVAAAGDEYHDNSYTTRGSKSEPIEVIPDEEYVDEGMGSKADSDAQLGT